MINFIAKYLYELASKTHLRDIGYLLSASCAVILSISTGSISRPDKGNMRNEAIVMVVISNILKPHVYVLFKC